MSKRAHVPIFANLDTVWVGLTEFGLVLLRMIKVLNAVMAAKASDAVGTWSVIKEVRTQFRNVVRRRTSTISHLALVVVKTLL